MALLYDGSYEGIQKRAIAKLKEEGFSVSPGSIAKLLVSIVNSEIADLYELLQEMHSQSFISTATGEFLDAIGMLLNCYREEDETDDTYRLKITNQILNVAAANETAIRLAALSVDGVTDVYLKNYSHGAGSFTLIVQSEYYDTSDSILLAVSNKISDVVAYGTKYHVIKPNYNKVSMTLSLILKDSVDDVAAREIKLNVKEKVKEYINSLPLGGNFIIDELTTRIMNSNEDIISYSCLNFLINNSLTAFVNQVSRWSDKFIVSTEPEAIKIL